MEDRPKETRAAHQASPRRNDSLFGTSGRRRRRRGEMEGLEDLCLSEPDFTRDSPSSQDGPQDAAGVSDSVGEPKPSPGRAGGTSDRHADTATEGLRNVAGGWKLGYGSPFRNYPSEHRHLGPSRGEGAGSQARASQPEAQGVHEEGDQIGSGQRARPGRLTPSDVC